MICWDTTLAHIRSLVRCLYLCPLLLATLFILQVPDIDYHWNLSQQSFLISMLMMAISTFPISGWIARRFLEPNQSFEPDTLADRLRSGAWVMAAMGEACAVYGWAVYFFSGDVHSPWIFFVLSGGHYALTMSRLDAAAHVLCSRS